MDKKYRIVHNRIRCKKCGDVIESIKLFPFADSQSVHSHNSHTIMYYSAFSSTVLNPTFLYIFTA